MRCTACVCRKGFRIIGGDGDRLDCGKLTGERRLLSCDECDEQSGIDRLVETYQYITESLNQGH